MTDLLSLPQDFPRRGEAFRHWKRGTIYVVTGASRSESDPDELDVLYKEEGAPEDAIPWRRSYSSFTETIICDGKELRRYEPVGRRQVGYCRREVVAFAVAMELRLRLNEHKGGGWKEEDPFDLLDRVVDEIDELDQAIENHVRTEAAEAKGGAVSDEDEGTAETRRRVLSESADVANFCMFVADACGSLEGNPSSERVYSSP